jgi:hypothetical protein
MTITFHAAPPAASPATASHLTHVGNKEIRKACTKTIQDGYLNAQIQPQVSGYLIKQSYKRAPMSARDRCSSRSMPGLFRRFSIKPRYDLLNRSRGWTLNH